MQLNVAGESAYVYTGACEWPHPAADNRSEDGLLFVHGAAMDHSVWLLQSRYFAHHGRPVLVPDLPGHGRSGGAPLGSVTALADWLMALLDVAGLERVVLVGHSMGALAVLDAAARYPQRVSRLALLGATAPMPVAAPLLDAARADSPDAIDMISIWGHAPESHFGGNPAPGLWAVGGGKQLLARAAPGVLFNDLNLCNDYQSGLQQAALIDCETLLLQGQRDMMTPPRAARPLAKALARSHAVVVPRCGHMLMYEQPDQTLDALIAFIN